MAKRKDGRPRSIANDRTAWGALRQTKEEQDKNPHAPKDFAKKEDKK